jgi:hypothetical protein
MNENIKTFSLVVITICVFIITVIDILNMIDERSTPQPGVYPSSSIHQPSAAQTAAANAPKTTLKFDETNFDFGDINEGDVVKHSFAFTNTGNNPLLITDVTRTCGCTIPFYPKEPIAPGAKGTIEVQFNSTGKKDLQDKTVTVIANTTPETTPLTFHANVHEKQ